MIGSEYTIDNYDVGEVGSINRDQFMIFLRDDHYSDRGAEQLIDILTTIVDPFIQQYVTPHHKTVFDITDITSLSKYYSAIMRDSAFSSLGSTKVRRAESALLEYIEYVKSLPIIEQHNALTTKDDVGVPYSKAITSYYSYSENETRVVKQNKRQLLIRQAQFILQPVEEYLYEYKIAQTIVFEYHKEFRDVDVIEPRFNRNLDVEASELMELVSLMRKYDIAVPFDIIKRENIARDNKELREKIRSFENWLVGYLVGLPLNCLEIDSISYSPDCGFKIGLSGTGIEPVFIRMKSCIVTNKKKTIR